MNKHLNLGVQANKVIVTGDTYNAKDALKAAGFHAQKVGYEWQYTYTGDPKTAVMTLAGELYHLVQPVIQEHLANAARVGFTPRPHDFAWTITMTVAGRQGHYFALETLVPARYEAGQLKPI